MPKKFLFFIVLILLAASIAASPRLTEYTVDWAAIGPGSTVLQHDGIELHGVIGQGIAGEVSQTQIDLCSGYLCAYWEWISTYFLPLFYR